jgi:hypothetical protein
MQRALLSRTLRIAAAVFCAVGAASTGTARAASTPSHKSPFVEIVGQARVETAPQKTVHKNHRAFLEFEITLTEARLAPDQPAHADRDISIDTSGRVRVVHDLSCGGKDLALAPGDRIEIEGEYVKIAPGKDLIHFTHAVDAASGCDTGSGHPGGYLRKLAPPTPRPPHLAAVVPDQPFRGQLPPEEGKAYTEIIRLRENGQSNEALLQKVQTEKIRYSLTTAQIQKLRASGVSTAVIEAMLASGRAARATPTPAVTPR